jgi:hypothetical protein
LDEARRLARAGHTDLALLDFNLHGKFADEISDILMRRKIPFLFVTGYDESSFALQGAIEALLPHE